MEDTYSILVRALCHVFTVEEGNARLISLSNRTRPNLWLKDNYYACQVLMDFHSIAPGETGKIEIEIIAFSSLYIEIGEVFELRAAREPFAKGRVLEVIRIRKL